jgi:F-type H+-transporting ATPase subunit gamma
MANLKDLKNRIDSVKSTQKITKAKKMVAASKLRRAQEAVEAARPYAARMERVIAGLASSVADQPGMSPLLVGTGGDKVHLVVVATSERGLCGSFNTSIVRAAREHISGLQQDGKTVKILCVGKKGHQQLRRDFSANIIDVIYMNAVGRLSFGDAQPIASRLLEMFEATEFDVCTLFFSRFKSALTQVVTGQQLIPATVSDDGDEDSEAFVAPSLGDAIYEYEPGEEEILQALLPRNVAVQLFRALLENAASEQGASMTAMDSATRNAGDMIDALTLKYNRTRQSVITSELIEIISGAEAL